MEIGFLTKTNKFELIETLIKPTIRQRYQLTIENIPNFTRIYDNKARQIDKLNPTNTLIEKNMSLLKELIGMFKTMYENNLEEHRIKEQQIERSVLDKVIHNKNHCKIKEQNIFEATPQGIVIMEYDEEEKSFNYWTDKTISYKYLQVVARRFVTEYQCKDYYIQCDEKDRTNHDSVKKDKIKQPSECVCENDECKLTESETDKSEEKDDSSLFIKKKTYTDNTVNISSNKYSHLGELKDYYGNVSKNHTSKNISFANFKKNNYK